MDWLHHCVCTVGASHPLFSYSDDSELSIRTTTPNIAFCSMLRSAVEPTEGPKNWRCRICVIPLLRCPQGFHIICQWFLNLSLLCTKILQKKESTDDGLSDGFSKITSFWLQCIRQNQQIKSLCRLIFIWLFSIFAATKVEIRNSYMLWQLNHLWYRYPWTMWNSKRLLLYP